MTFIQDPTENDIFDALMSRRTTFTINCIEFKEKLITGTVKERERKCRAKAKQLAKLAEGC